MYGCSVVQFCRVFNYSILQVILVGLGVVMLSKQFFEHLYPRPMSPPSCTICMNLMLQTLNNLTIFFTTTKLTSFYWLSYEPITNIALLPIINNLLLQLM